MRKNEIYQKIKPWMFLSTYIIVLLVILLNFSPVVSWMSSILRLFTSLFYGIGIAYVLNLPMKNIERILKRYLREGSFLYRKVRAISIALTLVLAIIVLVIIGSVVLPRLGDSLMQLVDNMSKYLSGFIGNINDILDYFHIDLQLKNTALKDFNSLPWKDILSQAANILGTSAGGIMNNTIGFVSEFFLWFTGFMFSFYMLSSKEAFIRQMRKVIAAALGEKKAIYIFDCGARANRIFASFISGQLLEACILFVIYYISMRLLNFPFPELISALIAICSIVPVFGSMFAMSIGAIMMLSIDPMKAVWFVIFYQLMQQFEDNVIYPRVVGNSVGLPGLWVLLSIFVFGDLFGVLGMIFAVPTTAFLYTMASDIVNHVLKKRHLRVDSELIEHVKEDVDSSKV